MRASRLAVSSRCVVALVFAVGVIAPAAAAGDGGAASVPGEGAPDEPRGTPERDVETLAPRMPAAGVGAEPPQRAPSPSQEAALRPLALHVAADPSVLDVEQVREAVAAELGLQVVLGEREAADVHVEAADGNVRVYYPRATGDLTRRIALPDVESERSVVVALLVGNLVRDQAGELLESWRPLDAEPPIDPPLSTGPAADPAPTYAQRDEVRTRLVPRVGTFLANFSLVPPIQTVRSAERHEFWMSFGALRSRVGAVHGLSATLGIADTLRFSKGINVAGLSTTVSGRVEGMLGALVWARAASDADGIVWSTGASSVVRRIKGMQVSLGVALAGRDLREAAARRPSFEGVQAAGVVGALRGSLRGAQLSGLVGLAERLNGVQLSGLAGIARSVDGAQISGLYNHAARVDGAQVGLVNWGRRVDGAQIGLVNVADELDGPEIGLINLHSKTRVQVLAWGSNTAAVNGGVRLFGGKGVYVMATALYDPARGGAPARSGPGISLGAHVPVRSLFFEGDANYSAEIPEASDVNTVHAGRTRLIAGWQVVDWLALFVGAGAKVSVRDDLEADSGVPEVVTRVILEPDLSAGIRVF